MRDIGREQENKVQGAEDFDKRRERKDKRLRKNESEEEKDKPNRNGGIFQKKGWSRYKACWCKHVRTKINTIKIQ